MGFGTPLGPAFNPLANTLIGTPASNMPGFPALQQPTPQQQQAQAPPQLPLPQMMQPSSGVQLPAFTQGTQGAISAPNTLASLPAAAQGASSTGAAAGGLSGALSKYYPWLMALSFLQQNASTPSASFRGGGSGGYSTGGGGLF
jgi:uncharacterized membrane protein YgcG